VTGILNVNASIDLKIGTGSGERTFQITRFLARQGHQCTVLTLDLGSLAGRTEALKPARVETLKCLWQRFFVPEPRWSKISRMVREADVIHLMNHWSGLNALVYLAVRRAGKPYVVCPAGALPMFGRSRLLKRIYNLLVGNAIVRNASAWVAVTEGEFPDFEAYGIAREKVSVIPNGVCEEDFPPSGQAVIVRDHGLTDVPFLLFVGRLSPIKGPDLLLQAFADVAAQLPDYHLVFAGPDGGMLAMLLDIAKRESLKDRVHFLGHVGGDDKVAIYRAARLLVVPSRREAMSLVALEAGICGTAVMLTDQCGFAEIRQIDPRLEVRADVQGIARGLTDLLGDPTWLDSIASDWHRHVGAHYTWDVMTGKYAALYERVLAGQAKK
jgi:glycosyltransferase involved in cell wall biosynthesis